MLLQCSASYCTSNYANINSYSIWLGHNVTQIAGKQTVCFERMAIAEQTNKLISELSKLCLLNTRNAETFVQLTLLQYTKSSKDTSGKFEIHVSDHVWVWLWRTGFTKRNGTQMPRRILQNNSLKKQWVTKATLEDQLSFFNECQMNRINFKKWKVRSRIHHCSFVYNITRHNYIPGADAGLKGMAPREGL